MLWSIRRKKAFHGFFLSLYIMGYGIVRFFIEMVREPDAQIGYFFGLITMGQILCLCMIAAGAVIFSIRRKSQRGLP